MPTMSEHASIILILEKDIIEQGFARFTIVFGLCTSYTFLAGIGQGVTEVQDKLPVDFLIHHNGNW